MYSVLAKVDNRGRDCTQNSWFQRLWALHSAYFIYNFLIHRVESSKLNKSLIVENFGLEMHQSTEFWQKNALLHLFLAEQCTTLHRVEFGQSWLVEARGKAYIPLGLHSTVCLWSIPMASSIISFFFFAVSANRHLHTFLVNECKSDK